MKKILCIIVLSMVFTIGLTATSWADNASVFSMTGCTDNSITVQWNYHDSIPSYYTLTGFCIKDSNNVKVYQTTNTLRSQTATIYNIRKGYTGRYTLYYTYTYSGNAAERYIAASYVNTKPGTLSKSSFGISNAYGNGTKGSVSFVASRPSTDFKTEIKVYGIKSGNCIATTPYFGAYSNSINVTYNVAYKYKARLLYVNSTTGKTYYGDWSSYRYFDYPKANYYTKTTSKGVKVKLKGLSYVSKYKLYVTTNSGNIPGTYTKTATPKKGYTTTYTINKIGKNSMKKGKTYYVRIKPIIKVNGTSYSSDIYGTLSFYNYK